MNDRITFVVFGHPQPAGSKRAFVNPKTGKAIVTDANANAKPWKQEIAQVAQIAMAGRPPLQGAVWLEVTFVLARPRGHYRTGRNAGKVRSSAPMFPAVAPDATKLLRGVEDALTGICWRDDAQVVGQDVTKVYGRPEGCEVTVIPSDGQSVGDYLAEDHERELAA